MLADLDAAEQLLARLCREPRETNWLEFKENYVDLEGIGEYVSALSNSAVLANRAHAYLVWGVQDGSHKIVGTTFEPSALKKGNEDFEPWLVRLLEPQVSLSFIKVVVGVSVVWILEIGAAHTSPVSFMGKEYIRVGSYKKPLRDHTDHQRRLWRACALHRRHAGAYEGRAPGSSFAHEDGQGRPGACRLSSRLPEPGLRQAHHERLHPREIWYRGEQQRPGVASPQ